MATVTPQTEIDYIEQLKSNKVAFIIRALQIYIRILSKISKKRGTKFITKLFLTPQRKTLSKSQLEYYNTGHSEFIRFNNNDIFVFTKGEGPIIMLAHGWGSNSYIFRHIIDALVEFGFSIVTFDYPAHGQSSGKQTSPIEISELLKILSDRYGSFKAIIAYSLGGISAIRALELGVQTEKLVLLSTPTTFESTFDPFLNLFNINPELQKLFFQELTDQTGVNRNRMCPMDMKYDKTVRTLIVHDKDDKIIPYTDAIAIHKELENSELILTSNLGHRGVPRTESIVREITNFLIIDQL